MTGSGPARRDSMPDLETAPTPRAPGPPGLVGVNDDDSSEDEEIKPSQSQKKADKVLMSS